MRYSTLQFFSLKAEVAGELGDKSVITDIAARPPVIEKLDFQLQWWRNSAICERILIFVVTTAASQDLTKNGLTGFELRPCTVSKTDEYYYYQRENDPTRAEKLPSLEWLHITGKPFVDDFGLRLGANIKQGLIVSERALAVLRAHNLDFAEVSEA